ncbi:Hpt domain-containing protein [Pedobacter alpinus]|uniref:Hpt domain-containing protein n=1 Tax=Pedobacter alpinus TaxID=1590643 RepID=A0ABW5TW18_9SPHI
MNRDNNIVIDLSYLKEVASDNTEFIVEMIDIFLEQTPGYVEVLTNAVETKDWSKIAEMAHKIKPTLAFMGVNEARDIMASIETRARDNDDYEGIAEDYKNLKEDMDLIFVKLVEKRKELLAAE